MTTKAAASSSSSSEIRIPIKNSSSSRFLQTVCLEDWWLIKSEDGNRLCIQGYTLSDRFLLGFPYDWEDVAGRCLGQESTAGNGAAALNSMCDFDESEDVISSLPNLVGGKEIRECEILKSNSQDGKLNSKVGPENFSSDVKNAPASVSSGVKNADPYEASVGVPVDIPSTKLAKADGVVTKRKRGRPKKKGKKSRSVPVSSGCGVVQVHVKDDLISHGSEGNLDRSKPETPIATVEDSSPQRLPEANVSCSIEVGFETFKVSPHKVTATRTSSRLKIIEGKGNRASKYCSSENVSSIAGPPMEDSETPKKVMMKSCESNPSSCNIDRVKEIMSSSKGRIKILANDLKDEQPTDYKIHPGSPGSKTVKKEVSPLPASMSKKKNQLSSGQEGPYLSPKRSRSVH
ncbi:hypothetical protein MKW92_011775 [Papaver armeniacum]|nr:hypothetical protein MKW92_011775 [Papaver armeniacum]